MPPVCTKDPKAILLRSKRASSKGVRVRDRTIQEARESWNIEPGTIELESELE